MADLRLPSINYVILSGRLTRDPELRYTPTGNPVLNMRLASSRRFQAGEEWKEETLYIDVVLWGPQAERLSPRLSKGSPVVVEGRLRYREWEGDTGKRSVIELVAWRVQALEKAGAEAPEGEAAPGDEAFPEFDEGNPEEEFPF